MAAEPCRRGARASSGRAGGRGELQPAAFPTAGSLLGFVESAGWRLGCFPA